MDSARASVDALPETNAYVCPFCGLSEDHASGSERSEGSPCPRCGMSDTPSTRKATKARIGPWHVRQVRNPWAPGMKWDTLLSLVKRGQVTATSIVRGPTTHQLWKRAGHVKGLSREFGLCYSCGESIETTASTCSHCNRLQEPPADRDVLLEGREGAPAVAPQPAPAPAQLPVSAPEPAETPEPAPPALPSAAPAPAPVAGNGNGNGHRRGDRRHRPLEKLRAAPVERPLNLPEKPATLDEGFKPAPIPHTDPPLARSAADDQPADALLSARELATAFQLDFNPPASHRRSSAGRALKLAAVLLLLAGSVACLLYVQPDLRERGMRWARDKFDSTKTDQPVKVEPIAPARSQAAPTPAPSVTLPTNRAPAAPTTLPAKNTALTGTPISAAPAILTTPASVQPAAKPNAATAPATAPAPVAKKTEKVQPPQVQPQVAAAVEKPRPTPAPAVIIPPSSVKVIEVKPEKTDAKPAASIDPVEQARQLWREAIDAEIKGKFRDAVNCYEQIKKLPADVQPEGLDVRLKQAREQLK